MAIIYSYPRISTINGSDLLPICDMSEEGFPTRAMSVSQLTSYMFNSSGAAGVSQILNQDNNLEITSTGPNATGKVTLDLSCDANEIFVGDPDKNNKTVVGSKRSTGAIILPQGTTAERPAGGFDCALRYNTEDCRLEVFMNRNACGDQAKWYAFELTPIN